MYEILGWIGGGVGVVTVIVLIVRVIFKIGVWKGSVDTDQTNFKEFMTEIKEKIDQIFSRFPPLLVTKKSPLSLTDLGKDVSNQLNATQWADKTAIVVLEKIKNKEPYDIQEFSFEYAQKDDSYSENERTLTRNVAYENGIKEEEARDIFGIELRDKLLKIEGKDAT